MTRDEKITEARRRLTAGESPCAIRGHSSVGERA